MVSNTKIIWKFCDKHFLSLATVPTDPWSTLRHQITKSLIINDGNLSLQRSVLLWWLKHRYLSLPTGSTVHNY
jgi:hypothetical protein